MRVRVRIRCLHGYRLFRTLYTSMAYPAHPSFTNFKKYATEQDYRTLQMMLDDHTKEPGYGEHGCAGILKYITIMQRATACNDWVYGRHAAKSVSALEEYVLGRLWQIPMDKKRKVLVTYPTPLPPRTFTPQIDYSEFLDRFYTPPHVDFTVIRLLCSDRGGPIAGGEMLTRDVMTEARRAGPNELLKPVYSPTFGWCYVYALTAAYFVVNNQEYVKAKVIAMV